jgi:lipopolysaccharide transport system permease protein
MISETILIEAGGGEKQYWQDVWRFKDLFFFFSWRDITVRYKHTAIGIGWNFIKPLLTTFAFVLVFNKVAKIESGAVPYAISVLAALLPWQFFSGALGAASESLVSNSNLISKVYFPRIIVPASSILINAVDFLVSLLLLILVSFYYHFIPPITVLYLPIFLILELIIVLGLGIFFSALIVRFRDFRFVVPFIIQFGLFISPVGFSSMVIPDDWRIFYSLNPMVGVIDGFRWAITGEDASLYIPSFGVSFVTGLLLLFIGIKFFRSQEKQLVDRL